MGLRKKIPFSLLLLMVFFALVLALPHRFIAILRNQVIHGVSFFRRTPKTEIAELEDQIKQLKIENNRLRNQPNARKIDIKLASADVIFRSTLAWQSALWINVGEQNAPFPLKNAPVLHGDVVVGVIEEVGPRESRVRLITDPQLNPSVRVQRNRRFLAKGEMNGALKPAFRRPGTLLKGTGFNYDFPDAEGPEQDLHASLIQKGDLLVTTGFDGVFPKGLKVAAVTRVLPLKEGDFYYDIEAESLAGSLNDLERLYLLPPLRF